MKQNSAGLAGLLTVEEPGQQHCRGREGKARNEKAWRWVRMKTYLQFLFLYRVPQRHPEMSSAGSSDRDRGVMVHLKICSGQGSPLLNYTSIRDATPGCASLWREGSSPPEDPRSSLCNGLGLVFGWLVLDRVWGSWRWASTPYPPAHTSKCPASHRFSLVLLR